MAAPPLIAPARGAALATALLSALVLPAPAAAQARAERLDGRPDSTRTIVLGLAALAALGLALRERDDDDDREEEDEEVEDEEVEERGDRDQGRLPARCLGVWWSDEEGPVELYDPDCLHDRLDEAGRLPLACAVTVRTEGRFHTGYAPSCLAEEGWRRERR